MNLHVQSTSNNSYKFKVFSHWISAYFLNDALSLPATPADTYAAIERNIARMRKCFPDMLLSTNKSYRLGGLESRRLIRWAVHLTVDEAL
ncbi:hypothetical protein HGRIS_004300 [Hohenbuehelia grisea]|uniref:Uncharacterized protein n=1 Tax=Hohenbuehelia grisea TaxID=104357 RepID=A0ABR3IPB9_9AGAR